MAKTALVAGSTGLIGGQLLELLLKDDRYSSVIAVSRKPLLVSDSKLINVVCELKDLAAHANELKSDDVFCCLGTTIKKAKSKENFRAVDYDAPVLLGKIAKENGAQKYLLVSSLGANKGSSIFYNQVKGEVEEAIKAQAFTSFHVQRPSLLLGPRKEERSGEDAAKVFYKIFGFLVPKKYMAIESIKVARAMIAFAQQNQTGVIVHESDELQSY
ncbi:MAG: NAD(P)H-binding protein [Bacteroidetes bacterium]|nr:NAD(P)H-binding protein [Bacteroidota bacterium]